MSDPYPETLFEQELAAQRKALLAQEIKKRKNEKKTLLIQLPSDDIFSIREVVGISYIFETSGDDSSFMIYLRSGHTFTPRGEKQAMMDLRKQLLLEFAGNLNSLVLSL